MRIPAALTGIPPQGNPRIGEKPPLGASPAIYQNTTLSDLGDSQLVLPILWIDTGAGNSLDEDGSLFSVQTRDSQDVFSTSSISTNIHSHYDGAGAASLSGYHYSGRMRMSHSKGGIGVTFLSQFPDEAAYYRLRRYGRNGDSLIAPAGTSISAGVVNTGVVPQPEVWYRFAIEVEDTGSRTEIRAKVWEDGTAEPTAWQVDCFDDSSSRLVSGTIGVWSMSKGSKDWDDLKVVGANEALSE